MSEKCGNCNFGREVEGLSSNKRLCTNKAGRAVSWILVDAYARCANYYVSYLAMIRENGDDKKYKGARAIPLTKGMYALVDECDYPQLSQYKWCMSKNGRNCYALRASGNKAIRMHRQITGAADGLVVDHIDNNGLNNRRSNLRVCTAKQNSRNCRAQKGTSKYKGVSWSKLKKKWQVSIFCDGRKKTIGYFKEETDAAKAYDEHARELFKEYAYLNFPVVLPLKQDNFKLR